MLEPLLEDADLLLVGASFPQLRQRFLGEVLERGAIGLRTGTEVRCRQVQGNAGFTLDLRKRLELRKRRNIDVKHRALTSQRRAETFVRCGLPILAEAPPTGIDGHQRAGNSSTQAKSHTAANPIRAWPHSSSPHSRIHSRTGDAALPAGTAHSHTFTGTITK
jgi:hypothetical protein